VQDFKGKGWKPTRHYTIAMHSSRKTFLWNSENPSSLQINWLWHSCDAWPLIQQKVFLWCQNQQQASIKLRFLSSFSETRTTLSYLGRSTHLDAVPQKIKLFFVWSRLYLQIVHYSFHPEVDDISSHVLILEQRTFNTFPKSIKVWVDESFITYLLGNERYTTRA
jgi:hypothetical protein